ncbi:OLC1v1011079C1 [Oldenlandia corymbosa var. corymbosa]|uniref:OLC1v1011079C1 n=1 Tax=Oldenlandia corymbosa var. corymbosa TaxID=529605 RepID=A0AAV1DVM2_OLDCO|nr:OLC1v1011079C1 [Oldenlandia corymbosa var. corymbosa]
MEFARRDYHVKRRRLEILGSGSSSISSKGKSSGNGNINQYEQDSSNCLPEWLLFEVLCKLPMKAVYKIKGVSKQCRSFISHPSFFEMYFARRPEQLCPLVFLSSNVVLIEEGTKAAPNMIPQPSRNLPEFHKFSLSTSLITQGAVVKIKAADKGFLLLGREIKTYGFFKGDYCTAEFFICNAMTNECFAVPKAPVTFTTKFKLSFIAKVVETGVLTSYRIVAILSPPGEKKIFRVYLFTPETGKWKKLRVHCDSPITHFGRRPVIVNNTLHWMYQPTTCDPRKVRGDPEPRIVVYEPYIDPHKFRIIEPPLDSRQEQAWLTDAPACGVSQGRLKYFKIMGLALREVSLTSLNVWELQQDQKWCLQHSIGIGEFLLSCFPRIKRIYVQLVAFHPFDSDIVYFYCHTNNLLVSYNARTKEVEHKAGVENFGPRFYREEDGRRIQAWPCGECFEHSLYVHYP